MKHTDSSLHSVSRPGWRLLGELELATNSDTDHSSNEWLTVILGPLNLQDDFVNKVLKSAQDAMERAVQTEPVRQFGHLHLLIFVPVEQASKGGTWGFFRIEKVERAADGDQNPDHAIEFYLYFEGE
jgi:hypothetical protein